MKLFALGAILLVPTILVFVHVDETLNFSHILCIFYRILVHTYAVSHQSVLRIIVLLRGTERGGYSYSRRIKPFFFQKKRLQLRQGVAPLEHVIHSSTCFSLSRGRSSSLKKVLPSSTRRFSLLSVECMMWKRAINCVSSERM